MRKKMLEQNAMWFLIGFFIIIYGCSGSGGSDNPTDENQVDGSSNITQTDYYAVAGNTEGLVGSGLVLQNNGGDDLTIDENGFFQFQSELENGESCDVTVATQPTNPEQVCQIVNGQQAVNGQDITNIEVQCETAVTHLDYFSVGGTTEGLEGSGFVLQNNGGDDLSIDENGSFQFQTELEDGESFEVTVATQPTNPEQVCQVVNGSQAVNGQDITNIEVYCETTVNPPGYYSIGGTTEGLAGSGLVLQNNGGDDLTINENGSFQFSTALTIGESCDVSVATQPTNPEQVCQVVNGSQTVDGQDITNIEVACYTGFEETFDSVINKNHWDNTTQYSRRVEDQALEYMVKATNISAMNSMPFNDESDESVTIDGRIESIDEGMGDYMLWLQTTAYHTSMEGDGDGVKTGDVMAAFTISGEEAPFDASYNVYLCLDNNCSTDSSIQILDSGYMGTIELNETARMMIDFGTIAEDQISFQLNEGTVFKFDPEGTVAPVDGPPNTNDKDLGVKSIIKNQASSAQMTAKFDNIEVDGLLYDDFDASNYPDLFLWGRPHGKVAIENGRLLIETGKEYSGDLTTDRGLHYNYISIGDDILPNAKIVEADIMMDSTSYVSNTGGNPVQGYAIVVAEFIPTENEANDLTDMIKIYAGLKEDPTGVTAEVSVTGCADETCSTTYIEEISGFVIPVEKNETHRFKIECLDTNIVQVTLDGEETVQYDFSGDIDLNSLSLDLLWLNVLTRGTDMSGEEALTSAYFDNVIVVEPL